MNDIGRIGVWAGQFDALPIAAVREAAVAVEDYGYGALWLHETTGREVFTQAALLLRDTGSIVVCTAADVYARDAVAASAGARTLDEAFPGRFALGLWGSHPSIAEDVRGHTYAPPAESMRGYVGAMSAPPRTLTAFDRDTLALAAEHGIGAHLLGTPVEFTRTARDVVGAGGLVAVTQFCVLGDGHAGLAGGVAAAALPLRRELLAEHGHLDDDAVVAALVAHGGVADVADRVAAHFDAGADHVSLFVVTRSQETAPLKEWRALADRLA